ncbi:MAG TPA: 1,4-dihydroxy-2-naphthoate octaprenyltransferase [Miltoncostaeaceae bacterium]|nr:1,4-dihydroxy-2-naphthoate octaprenyltransferase [Miltoncostaeaceae bacterium]
MSTTALSGSSRAALYWRATRPLYLPTSVLPALVGALVAVGAEGARWWLLPVALVAMLLVHCGVNVTNDVEDHARGVDGPEKLDNSRVFTLGLLGVREGRLLAWGYFGLGALLGVLIVAVQGPALLVVGTLGILGGWLYTAGPRPYKYLGLGDTLIIPLMGPMITQGAYTAITGEGFHAPAAAVGLVPGLLVAAVVQGNNLSDILEDGRAGIRTLAVRLGFGRARVLYLVSLTLGFAVLPVLWLTGMFGPAVMLPLVLAPLALARARQALSARGPGEDVLRTLAPATAQVHLGASVLLAVGVLLDRALG